MLEPLESDESDESDDEPDDDGVIMERSSKDEDDASEVGIER